MLKRTDHDWYVQFYKLRLDDSLSVIPYPNMNTFILFNLISYDLSWKDIFKFFYEPFEVLMSAIRVYNLIHGAQIWLFANTSSTYLNDLLPTTTTCWFDVIVAATNLPIDNNICTVTNSCTTLNRRTVSKEQEF